MLGPAFFLAGQTARYVLYLPMNAASVLLYLRARRDMGRRDFGILVRTLSRLLKFATGALLVCSTVALAGVEHMHVPVVWGAVLLAIDLVRAYLYEVSRRSFENKVLTGYFADILRLEKYIVHSVEGPGAVYLDRDLQLREFFERGRPRPIDIDELFRLWNDQNPYAGSSSESEMVAENQQRVRKRWRVSISPETYEFGESRGRGCWDVESIAGAGLTQDEECREKKFAMDRMEILSESEIDYHDDADESLSGERWSFLEGRAAKLPARPGLVTVESLRVHFGEEHAAKVYALIAFKRGEGINYDVFLENGRQINNERNNLFRTVQDNKNLLRVVWVILVVIEAIAYYLIIATHLKTHPLLLELMIPVMIVPALPIAKVTLESFLFIVYTHPYDPGDRVHIDGENMVVRAISLFYTTLERWDGLVVTMPNMVIRDKAISNIRRSRLQQGKLEIMISAKTPEKKVELLREAVRRFVRSHKLYVTASVNIEELVDATHMRLRIIVKHAINFQSGFFMWTNHTRFASMVVAAMCVLNIKFRPVDMEIVDVSQ